MNATVDSTPLVGKSYHACGPIMHPVDGLFDPVDDTSVEARCELDSIALRETGKVRFIFDCGIEGEVGSFPFAIELYELTDDYAADSRDSRILPEYRRDAVLGVQLLALALEAEAARLRSIAASASREIPQVFSEALPPPHD